ncbi:flagellar motor switch protein FliG [Angustibacter sp. McL0619]|uniref:flagellar motor switch protein FliG n=1 Tax=Angustibacter sp. McL0619 TaxID=3415676 RepID=UPI003CEB8CDE
MTEPAVAALTGPQKVAIVLMQIGRERSAPILSQLREAEIEEVAGEIVRLRSVAPEVVESVLQEFQDAFGAGAANAAGGGVEVAHELLAATFGSERASAVIDRLAKAHATDAFSFLADADPRTLVSFLSGEHPQVVAVVLAHLQLDQASVILSGLPPDQQAEVAHRIGTMERTNHEMVRVVADVLERQTSTVLQPGRNAAAVGGVQPLVDLINRADPATERIILESLESRDPALAEAVRARLFVFEDVTTLEDRGVQLVLRQVETGDLAVALKGVTDLVREKVLSNVSERARENLLEEIGLLGPQRVAAVEEARAKIVQVIRSLEESGQIMLRRGGDDEYVD